MKFLGRRRTQKPLQYGVEDRIVQFFGLRRSGNHAVISWIIDSLEGRVLHLNNISCAQPYECFARARAHGFSRYELYRKCAKIRGRGGLNRYVLEHLVGFTKPSETLNRQQLDPGIADRPKAALLLSYEDWQLDHPMLPRILRPTARGTERGAKCYKALLLRDPYNLFASLLHSGRMTGANSGYYVRAWKQHAREHLGLTSHLGEGVLHISYNRWRDSAEYRAQLRKTLDLPDDSAAYAHVPKTGGGSSFDGVAPDAAQLRTHERWKQYAETEHFRRLFDAELRELSAQIFGSPPF